MDSRIRCFQLFFSPKKNVKTGRVWCQIKLKVCCISTLFRENYQTVFCFDVGFEQLICWYPVPSCGIVCSFSLYLVSSDPDWKKLVMQFIFPS